MAAVDVDLREMVGGAVGLDVARVREDGRPPPVPVTLCTLASQFLTTSDSTKGLPRNSTAMHTQVIRRRSTEGVEGHFAQKGVVPSGGKCLTRGGTVERKRGTLQKNLSSGDIAPVKLLPRT